MNFVSIREVPPLMARPLRRGRGGGVKAGPIRKKVTFKDFRKKF